MGEIRKYKCKCGYEEELFVGSGFNGCNMEEAMIRYPDNMKKFLEEKKKGMATFFELTNLPMACKNCGKLEVVPALVIYKSNETTEKYYDSLCEECGEKLKPEEDGKIKCPVCDNDIEYVEVGSWD